MDSQDLKNLREELSQALRNGGLEKDLLKSMHLSSDKNEIKGLMNSMYEKMGNKDILRLDDSVEFLGHGFWMKNINVNNPRGLGVEGIVLFYWGNLIFSHFIKTENHGAE